MPGRRLHAQDKARGNDVAGQRGIALVEFALILPLLLSLVVGIAEFGLAFKDFLSVSNAAREGARVAASAGNEPTADCSVRVHLAESFIALNLTRLDRLEIFQANSNGDPIPGRSTR
ncbi:MAG: pilus assembly protein, partial [Acidimicrobiia bacterium]|nr:pilus assembly protein [Acidimicrobiia bacterium]